MTRTTILKSKEFKELFFRVALDPGIKSGRLLTLEEQFADSGRKSTSMKYQNLKKQGYIRIVKRPGMGKNFAYYPNYAGVFNIIMKKILKYNEISEFETTLTAYENIIKGNYSRKEKSNAHIIAKSKIEEYQKLLNGLEGHIKYSDMKQLNVTLLECFEGWILYVGRVFDAIQLHDQLADMIFANNRGWDQNKKLRKILKRYGTDYPVDFLIACRKYYLNKVFVKQYWKLI